jgi:hypothetical protein
LVREENPNFKWVDLKGVEIKGETRWNATMAFGRCKEITERP